MQDAGEPAKVAIASAVHGGGKMGRIAFSILETTVAAGVR
jgi:hypothetical protein